MNFQLLNGKKTFLVLNQEFILYMFVYLLISFRMLLSDCIIPTYITFSIPYPFLSDKL